MDFLTDVIETTVPVTEAATEAAQKLDFQPGRFVEMLQYMGIGMLVIFVLIGVIILSTMAINAVFSKKK